MTMNRVESAPDLLRELKQLERMQREKKERQIVGADAVRTFIIKTNATWDWQGQTSVDHTGARTKSLTVTFRPDSTGGDRFAAGLRLMAKAEVVGLPGAKVAITVLRRRVTNRSEQSFTVIVHHFGDETVRVKFFVSATGRGTISVV